MFTHSVGKHVGKSVSQQSRKHHLVFQYFMTLNDLECKIETPKLNVIKITTKFCQ